MDRPRILAVTLSRMRFLKKRHLKLVWDILSPGNIKRMEGEDKPILDLFKKIASFEAPEAIDSVIEDFFSDFDLQLGAYDLPEDMVVRAIVSLAPVITGVLRENVLKTRVEELAARAQKSVSTATGTEAMVSTVSKQDVSSA